jgi:hypothetical protein
MSRHLFAALFVVCSSSMSSAESLKTDLADFEPLIGTWACAGHNSPSPQLPAFDFDSTFTFEAALGGQFVHASYTESVSEMLPMSRDNEEFWQSVDGSFTSTFFNAFGQSGQLHSDGLIDGVLTWAGKLNTPNGPMPFEGRIVLLDNQIMTVAPTLLFPDGTEFSIATLSCQREG